MYVEVERDAKRDVERERALDAQFWCVRGGLEMQRKRALDAELVCT